MAKPFIKWAGGKGQLLSTIRGFYPKELGVSIKKYCEPMVGAGAVLFDILNNYEMKEIYICDSNVQLINLYKVIQGDVEKLIKLLSQYETNHLNKSDEDRKEYYYQQRETYNTEIKYSNGNNAIIRASLFIYLNKILMLYHLPKTGDRFIKN